MIRLEHWKPRAPAGAPWLRLLDGIDARVLEHRFYRFCTWLALHPAWRPTSAAHARPGGRPYYIAADCPTCSTPLVLHDRLGTTEQLADDQVWHDEWMCPQCRDGIWLDWPESSVSENFGIGQRN
jgi:hypothetical protein